MWQPPDGFSSLYQRETKSLVCVDYGSKPCMGLAMRVRRGRKTARLCYRNMGSEQARPGHVSYCHEERSIRLLVHGDDFLVLADEEGHAIADRVLRERYEFKCGGHIGPGQTKQSMSVLNRMVTYHPDSGLVAYEADPRHCEAIVRELGLEKAKPAKTRHLLKRRNTAKQWNHSNVRRWMMDYSGNTDLWRCEQHL